MEVRINEIDDSKPDQFKVVAYVNGKTVKSVFLKGEGWREEDDNGVPKFVKHMKDQYMRRYESNDKSDTKKYERTTYEV